MKSSTRLMLVPEKDTKESSVDDVDMNSVFDSLHMRPTAAAAPSSDWRRVSAFFMDSEMIARSSAKSRSVKYGLAVWSSI